MSSKEVIVEEITSFEGIGRVSKMLDQLVEGLKSLGVFRLMRLFPDQFVNLFVHSCLTAQDVLENMKFSRLRQGDKVAAEHLQKFIVESTEKVLKDLMLFITGSYQPSPFTVLFISNDDGGHVTVSAHACPKELHLPRGVFEEEDEETYSKLSEALVAAMDATYNTI
ncbi:uncharacterized protein [Dysidea avara]